MTQIKINNPTITGLELLDLSELEELELSENNIIFCLSVLTITAIAIGVIILLKENKEKFNFFKAIKNAFKKLTPGPKIPRCKVCQTPMGPNGVCPNRDCESKKMYHLLTRCWGCHMPLLIGLNCTNPRCNGLPRRRR